MHSPSPQLYVVVTAGPAASAQLGAALAAGRHVAAVLIKGGAVVLDATAARPLIELAQKANVAALVGGDATLARALRADGVHLPWSPALASSYAEARDILGTRFMVGVEIAAEAATARHDAMELAEAGADYIGFDCEASGTGALDLVDWWADIFEVPCVAFGVASGEAAASVGAAEFIGITLAPELSAVSSAALVRDVAAGLDARQREVAG